MITIWKFELDTERVQDIEMPAGAMILHRSLQVQHGFACVWATCDPTAPKIKRRFWTFFTDEEIPLSPEEAFYLGTYLTNGGDIVRHVFVKRSEVK